MVLPSSVMGQLHRDLCSCFTLEDGGLWWVRGRLHEKPSAPRGLVLGQLGRGERGEGRERGRPWAPHFPRAPALPFCFWGRLQGTQCDQQLLGGDEGLHRWGRREGEVDDLGHRETWQETGECGGGSRGPGLAGGRGSYRLPSEHHSRSEHGTRGPGHTQSPRAGETPQALFLHSLTSPTHSEACTEHLVCARRCSWRWR